MLMASHDGEDFSGFELSTTKNKGLVLNFSLSNNVHFQLRQDVLKYGMYYVHICTFINTICAYHTFIITYMKLDHHNTVKAIL